MLTNTTPKETQERVLSKRAQRKGRQAVDARAKQLGRLSIEYVALTAIAPNDYNPNRQSDHDFELLLRSIEEDGFTQPVIVTRENIIVDGEHRWRAALALGMTEIPIVRVDMSAEQARMSTIRHNRARGSHDVELEAAILKDLESLGALEWAQTSLMMDDAEVARLLEDIGAPEAYAAEEFSEAWIPDKFLNDESARKVMASTAPVTIQHQDGQDTVAATTAAVELQRKRETLIKEAKTEQEREQRRRESALYRVSLIFSGDEAAIVKEVLAESPAEKLLELCKATLSSS